MGGDIEGEGADDLAGIRISLSSDGTIIVIGAINNDSAVGENSGHVRIYKYIATDNSWIQIGYDLDGEAVGDQAGKDVELSSDGTKITVGAWKNNNDGSDAGHVQIYVIISEFEQEPIHAVACNALVISKSLTVSASNINFSGIPTSDQGISGRLWSDSGTLKISSG